MAATVKRKLSKTSIGYVTIGVILISLMTMIGASAFMRIKEIRVEGMSMYTPEEIVESSGLHPGDNLMFINTANISQVIRGELPFINEVKITRKLPDTVLIEVAESTAAASISFYGELIIIDSTGRVLARGPVADLTLPGVDTDNLVNIRGVEIDDAPLGSILKPEFGTELKLQYVQDILSVMEREGLIDDVSYLDVSNIVNVYFGYSGKYRVILGGRTNLRPSSLRQNLSRMPENIEQFEKTHPNTMAIINMSDESGAPKFTPTSNID